jgi:hypothetical protein
MAGPVPENVLEFYDVRPTEKVSHRSPDKGLGAEGPLECCCALQFAVEIVANWATERLRPGFAPGKRTVRGC